MQVYFANLAAYNAGKLVGAWIEPSDEALEEYAQDMADEGVLDKEWLLQYVDWERVARDLSMDLHVVEHDGKTYIFNE